MKEKVHWSNCVNTMMIIFLFFSYDATYYDSNVLSRIDLIQHTTINTHAYNSILPDWNFAKRRGLISFFWTCLFNQNYHLDCILNWCTGLWRLKCLMRPPEERTHLDWTATCFLLRTLRLREGALRPSHENNLDWLRGASTLPLALYSWEQQGYTIL